MRQSFSDPLYRPFFRNDIEVVHAIGGLPRLVNTSPHRDFKFVAGCRELDASSHRDGAARRDKDDARLGVPRRLKSGPLLRMADSTMRTQSLTKP